MEQQYYVKTNADGQALVLYRMDLDNEAETLDELAWGDGKWANTDRLVAALVEGDPDTFQITEEQARELAPGAFSASPTLVSKAVAERRFTLGPMYVPGRLDAHAEWTDPDELQKAVWEYVRKGDRRIRLQHDRDVVAGEFVEIMAWPYEVDVPMMMKDASTRNMTFPANTVFLGVTWEPWAWELVKAGKVRGYSIGGRAQRMYVDLPEE